MRAAFLVVLACAAQTAGATVGADGLDALLAAAGDLGGGESAALDALLAQAASAIGNDEQAGGLDEQAEAAARRQLLGGFSGGGLGGGLGGGGLGGLLGGGGGVVVGAAKPPEFAAQGRFVLDLDGKSDENTERLMKETPSAGIFVDSLKLSLVHQHNMTDEDTGEPLPNSTVAQTFYRMTPCVQAYCADMLDPDGGIMGTTKGDATDGTYMDRADLPMASGPVVLDTPGVYFFEVFSLMVDLTKRDENWMLEDEIDVVETSPMTYANFTVVPGVQQPVFDPPQDFYSGKLNVTVETVTDDASVFFTLQPPFIYDLNGTWCPHMGSWCAGFPPDQTFHAVPNQPPAFLYSARGLYTRLLDIPYDFQLNVTVPFGFPFFADSNRALESLVSTHAISTTA